MHFISWETPADVLCIYLLNNGFNNTEHWALEYTGGLMYFLWCQFSGINRQGKSSLTFKFMVLRLVNISFVTRAFSCAVNFRGLTIPTKTTNIGITYMTDFIFSKYLFLKKEKFTNRIFIHYFFVLKKN